MAGEWHNRASIPPIAVVARRRPQPGPDSHHVNGAAGTVADTSVAPISFMAERAAGEELVGDPGGISVAFHEGDAMTAAAQEQGSGEPAQAASCDDDVQIVPVHVAQPVGAGAGTRPSCSSIASRSKIRLKETCRPSR